jgi:ferredoxin
VTERLAVDRIRCDGRGICADLLPEIIDADDWGYPVIASGPVPAELTGLARLAVSSCPVMALRLETSQLSGNSKADPRGL